MENTEGKTEERNAGLNRNNLPSQELTGRQILPARNLRKSARVELPAADTRGRTTQASEDAIGTNIPFVDAPAWCGPW